MSAAGVNNVKTFHSADSERAPFCWLWTTPEMLSSHAGSCRPPRDSSEGYCSNIKTDSSMQSLTHYHNTHSTVHPIVDSKIVDTYYHKSLLWLNNMVRKSFWDHFERHCDMISGSFCITFFFFIFTKILLKSWWSSQPSRFNLFRIHTSATQMHDDRHRVLMQYIVWPPQFSILLHILFHRLNSPLILKVLQIISSQQHLFFSIAVRVRPTAVHQQN